MSALGAREPGAVPLLWCCSCGSVRMLRRGPCEGRWDVRGQSGTWEGQEGGERLVRAVARPEQRG